MTAPPSPDHLDDEALSALLDGAAEGPAAAAHTEDCTTCSARLAALAAARHALRAATVAPLPATTLDDLVGSALRVASAGGGTNESARVLPIGTAPVRRRGRRLQTPPPAWLLGAAAALAAVVGLAGLLRAGGTGGDDMVADSAGEAATLEYAEGGVTASDGTVSGSGGDVVIGDLGDIADTGALEAALAAPPGAAITRSAQATAGGGDRATEDGADADQEAAASSAAPGPTAPPGAGGAPNVAAVGPLDRARCRTDAERIGAGRLGALVTTATLRWAGQPAEVLVFALVEPAGGFSRQALVLARPGCALLADPQW